MLVIRTATGVEIRIPVSEIESVHEVEAASGAKRTVAPHPYLHREGVSRCAACWELRTHPSHTDLAVHER